MSLRLSKRTSIQLALVFLSGKWSITLDNTSFWRKHNHELREINHNLLIANFHTHGFDKSSFKLLDSLLKTVFKKKKEKKKRFYIV